MRVLKIEDLPEKPMGTATAIDGWTGGAVKRTRQELITDGQSDNFRCNVVNFSAGAMTGWRAHDLDQILVVTAGRGVVANETEQREITATWCTSRRENATGTAPRRIRYCRTSR